MYIKLVFILLYSLLIIGCSDVDKNEIVGKWTALDKAPCTITEKWSGETIILIENSEITFFDDGTFHAVQFPLNFIGSKNYVVTDGNGNWNITDKYGYTQIALKFNELRGYKGRHFNNLEISNWFGDVELFFWMGEEGTKKFKYIKE